MFAVLKTGGKQYRVSPEDVITVEKLAASAGEKVQFNDVLMVGGDSVTIGAPFVDGAAVQAEIVEQTRGEKTISFKKRRRKHSSKRRKGHRQYLTVVRVTEILASGAGNTGVKAALGAGTLSREESRALNANDDTDPDLLNTPRDLRGSAAALVSAPVAETKAPAAAKKAAKAAAKPAESEVAEAGPAADAVKPANLLTEAQGEPDDLKRISGVGPKLEGLLHENGVFHFWQIADWGPNEIAYMDDKLSFKGRIDRENWIEQAKEFAAEAK